MSWPDGNPVWPPPPSGGAPLPPALGDLIDEGYMRFGGIDEYVTLGNLPDFDFAPSADAFSVSLWARVGLNHGGTAVSNWRVSGVYSYDGWFLTVTHDRVVLTFRRYNTSAQALFTGFAETDAWRHFLLTWDTTTASCWIDGAAQTPKTPSFPDPTYNVNNDVRIGNAVSLTSFFRGDLKQVAVWSSDQSASAAAIYNSGVEHDMRALATPPDLLYMPFNVYADSETASGRISDLSGNGYNGSGVNFEGDELVAPYYFGDSR